MSCPMINTSARPLRACVSKNPNHSNPSKSSQQNFNHTKEHCIQLHCSPVHYNIVSLLSRSSVWLESPHPERVSNPVHVALEYHLHNATLLFLSFPPMTSMCRVVVRWAEYLVKLGPPRRIEYRLPRSVAARVQCCHPRATARTDHAAGVSSNVQHH